MALCPSFTSPQGARRAAHACQRTKSGPPFAAIQEVIDRVLIAKPLGRVVTESQMQDAVFTPNASVGRAKHLALVVIGIRHVGAAQTTHANRRAAREPEIALPEGLLVGDVTLVGLSEGWGTRLARRQVSWVQHLGNTSKRNEATGT